LESGESSIGKSTTNVGCTSDGSTKVSKISFHSATAPSSPRRIAWVLRSLAKPPRRAAAAPRVAASVSGVIAAPTASLRPSKKRSRRHEEPRRTVSP